MNDVEQGLRQQLIRLARALEPADMGVGTAGNLSARFLGGCLITPSGVPYAALEPADLAAIELDGRQRSGALRPSSEWRLHAAIYRSRRDVGAVVHAHPPFATALACTGRGIPAFHYMVAVAGGVDIPLVPYALFGTAELAAGVAAALVGRDACLLANHGILAVGEDPAAAFGLAREVENLARQYCEALKLGDVRLLSAAQMAAVLERFADYGQRR